MVQSSCGHGSAAFPILCVVSPVQCGVPGFLSALALEDFDNCYGKSHLQGFFVSCSVLLNLILPNYSGYIFTELGYNFFLLWAVSCVMGKGFFHFAGLFQVNIFLILQSHLHFGPDCIWRCFH